MSADAVITCGLCFTTIKDAVQLNCSHNFCLSCVENSITENRNEEKVIKCCLCYSETPSSDLESLRNRDLDAYIVMLEKGSNSVFVCQWCDLVPATLQCNSCAAAYCEDCSTAVHKHSARKSHKIDPLTDSPNSFLTRCTQTGHEEYKAEFFCTECEELCCAYCLRVGPHLNHRNTDLSSAAQEAKKQISQDKPEAEKACKRLEKMAEEVKSLYGKYESTYENVANLVSEKFREYRAQLQRAETAVMEHLSSLREGGDATLMGSRTDFLSKVNGLLFALLRVESSDTDSKILRNKMLLNACMTSEFVPLTGKGFLLNNKQDLEIPDISVDLDLHSSDKTLAVGFSPIGKNQRKNSSGKTMTDVSHGRRGSPDVEGTPPSQRKLSDRHRGGRKRSDVRDDGRRERASSRTGSARSRSYHGSRREDHHGERESSAGNRNKRSSERHRDAHDSNEGHYNRQSYPVDRPHRSSSKRGRGYVDGNESHSGRSNHSPRTGERNLRYHASRQGEDRQYYRSSAGHRGSQAEKHRSSRSYYQDTEYDRNDDRDGGGLRKNDERGTVRDRDREKRKDIDDEFGYSQRISSGGRKESSDNGAYNEPSAAAQVEAGSKGANRAASDSGKPKKRRCCPELDNPLRLTFPVDEDVEAICRSDGIQFHCIARGNATTQIGVRSQETFLDVDRKYPEDRGVVSWRIRLDIIADVFVGVVEQGSTAGSSGFFWKPGCSHVVDGKIGNYTAAVKNLPVCSTGDVVGFLYDVHEQTLRLFVNDEDYGIVVTDLTNYISACFILYPGETVTVLY